MTDMKSKSGIVIGYDPGGRDAHGVAELLVEAGRAARLSTITVNTTEEVITRVEATPGVVALGIDTLTCWGTGPGGWRPADHWLRERYPQVAQSVMAPNGLRGSMALNGMALLMAVGPKRPELFVTETHPKVLFWFFAGSRYDYTARKEIMDSALARVLGIRVAPSNEHEWDAALSAFAALEGLSGRWTHDLHRLETRDDERLLLPCGMTHYLWPE
jgi:hypothetical protein